MTTTRPALDTATAVLGFARESRATADRAEADLLLAAVTWAEQHPPESIALAATWPGTEGELKLAGEGAPTVAEFAIAEFAAAIGRSTDPVPNSTTRQPSQPPRQHSDQLGSPARTAARAHAADRAW